MVDVGHPTCLFTGEVLIPEPRQEHAIPRSIGGRIRSRRISSNRFNNATSNGYDDLLAAPYSNIFNYLAPLLAAEHAQADLEFAVGDGRQHRLRAGGQVGLQGMRIDERDERGQPSSVSHEDPEAVLRFAANAGWEPGSWQMTHEIAASEPEGNRRLPVLHPKMEIAALKCALLAFDEVLADSPGDRFTRNGWLNWTRNAIRDVVLNGGNPVGLIDRVSWGLRPCERDRLRALRQELIRVAETPFEHVLVASGDARTGALDVAWLLADTDVWSFRLTRLWNGPAFTAIAGCGILRGTSRWQPVVTRDVRWQLGQRSVLRSVHRGLSTEQMTLLSDEMAAVRHDAFRRAVAHVELECDEVVKHGILNFARFHEAEPVVAPGDQSIVRGMERRLRRLYYHRCADPAELAFLEQTIARAVELLPVDVRTEHVTRDGQDVDAVSWPQWIECHRSVLRAVAGRFGPPGHIRSISLSAESMPP